MNDFYAPFVLDCSIKIELKYLEEYHIKANNTILILGKIVDLHIYNEIIEDDGFVNLTKGKIAAISGLDSYVIPHSNKRLGYQRPRK